jgi:recombination protein RecT
MPETQLAAKPSPRRDIRDFVEGMRDQFKLALPKILTPERFTRVALTCINKNPKLLECTRDSLLACLLDCAALGIEPDGRRAHLIPYGKVCTLIIDYKGIAELVRRSGEISTLHCGIVYPADHFDYAFGTGQFLNHKPAMSRDGKEKPVCVYSYVKLKDGQEDFDVMSIDDVDRIRKRSRAGNNGPWVTDFDEMAKKTVFRRHSKWLPLSPELREKIEKDDEALTEQERFAAAKPANASDIEFGPALPEPTDEAPQEEPDAPEKKKKPAPLRATARETLRNLMVASKIEEKNLLVYLFSVQKVEQGETLDKLSDDHLKEIIDSWMSIAPEIEKEA